MFQYNAHYCNVFTICTVYMNKYNVHTILKIKCISMLILLSFGLYVQYLMKDITVFSPKNVQYTY